MDLVVAFLAGLALATVATPVGVSGAVLLLPVHLTLLGVPNPAVSPTNLLFNLVSVPGALLRYQRAGRAWLPLARTLLRGALPGVVVGAVVRVVVLPDGTLFRVLVAVLLTALGVGLIVQDRRPGTTEPSEPSEPMLSDRAVTVLGLAAGLAGGIYGIGGGSLVAPVLVLAGFALPLVAPAVLLATLVTSVAGLLTFVALAVGGHPESSPHWGVGVTAGFGGLVGGYLGAGLQPHLPSRSLRLGLAALMLLIAGAYATGVLLVE